MKNRKKYVELNEQQCNIMFQAISKEEYDWEQKYLENKLLGMLPNERHGYGKQLDSNSALEMKCDQIINKINEYVNNYNRNITKSNNNEILHKIKEQYKELYKFGTVKSFYTYEEDIEKEMIFNKVFLISGIGGMGKSQYLYELERRLKREKYNHLTIYGKYCETLNESILKEIIQETKKEKFYFIIDAINECDAVTRDKILSFIKENRNNENMRTIISYRSYSLSNLEYKKIKSVVTNEETFLGVSSHDALEKISEKYNLDLVVYEDMLENNNPYQLKLLIKYISNNRLITDMKKPLEKGTYIYENIIQEAMDKDRWWQTKDIVKEIIRSKNKRILVTSIFAILGSEALQYINDMKRTGFANTYKLEEKDYFIFLNENLLDYLISRTLFDSIIPVNINLAIEVINEAINDFYSIGGTLILMIFERFKNRIEDALYIVDNSELKQFLNFKIFNELSLSLKNQLYVLDNVKVNDEFKNILLNAGGNHCNPFNCKNYLNNILLSKKKLISTLKYDKYDIYIVRKKLKVWARSIAKYNYNEEYINEKFWFAFWISALPNGNIRLLARKLIFEIVNENKKYIETLIALYYKVSDDYIKEAIIHVLSSLEKNNKLITSFFNEINTENMLNINIMCFISRYLSGKESYTDFEKIDVLNGRDKNFNIKIFDFFSTVDFSFKDEYRMFGMNVYKLNKKSICFQDKFLKCPKKIISKVNGEISSVLKCVDEYCPAYDIVKNTLKFLYSDVSKEEIASKDVYLAWQSQFKKFMKKYDVKIDELVKSVYERDEKNNVYKVLDLAISSTVGSIASNYYTTDFCEYSKIGYNSYQHDFYHERPSLYYPIGVYSEDIEKIDNKVVKKIKIPTEKNEEWLNDSESSILNLRKIIEPVTYKEQQWRLIYGNVRKSEKNENNKILLWEDTYILNLAIDEKHVLCYNSNTDRKYTIETPELYDNIENILFYNFTRTSSVKESYGYNDTFVQTDFNIPPTEIIRMFKLTFNKYNNSWITPNGEAVVLVNNNKGVWYNDGMVGSLYIKEKYFQEVVKEHDIKYFAFTERFCRAESQGDRSAMQVELFLDNTEKHYNHYAPEKEYLNEIPKSCLKCGFYKEYLKQEENMKKCNYEIVLKKQIEKL